jgi:hypothetical protein
MFYKAREFSSQIRISIIFTCLLHEGNMAQKVLLCHNVSSQIKRNPRAAVSLKASSSGTSEIFPPGLSDKKRILFYE